jgi:uncharacterized membrane protein
LTDTTTKESEQPVAERASQNAILLAAIGYVPLLFFLPLFTGTREPFARFHGRQSLVMFGAIVFFNIGVEVTDFILGRTMGAMFLLGPFFRAVAWLIHYPVGGLVAATYAVLLLMGIVQAATGQYWRIPVVGAYAERLNL